MGNKALFLTLLLESEEYFISFFNDLGLYLTWSNKNVVLPGCLCLKRKTVSRIDE